VSQCFGNAAVQRCNFHDPLDVLVTLGASDLELPLELFGYTAIGAETACRVSHAIAHLPCSASGATGITTPRATSEMRTV
jgi:hypothetical protein